jgi:hypothetical protein
MNCVARSVAALSSDSFSCLGSRGPERGASRACASRSVSDSASTRPGRAGATWRRMTRVSGACVRTATPAPRPTRPHTTQDTSPNDCFFFLSLAVRLASFSLLCAPDSARLFQNGESGHCLGQFGGLLSSLPPSRRLARPLPALDHTTRGEVNVTERLAQCTAPLPEASSMESGKRHASDGRHFASPLLYDSSCKQRT